MRIAYRFIFVLLLAAIVWQIYGSLESKRLATSSGTRITAPASQPQSAPGAIALATAASDARFSCDGRTTCTQMRSCEEAKYFLKNCPRTEKMDGNQDGVPCQILWCR